MKDLVSQSLALSLGVSALITVVCRKLKIPALLPLLAAGLALGTSGLEIVDGSSLGHSLKGFITVAIGLLIFEGALHLNREDMRRSPRAVWGLLTIGALVTWGGATLVAWKFLNMSPQVSVLLGACIIVTGPTVVQPLLRILNLSPRLHVVLSAEAVLIDPIGVVAAVATLEVLRLHSLLGPGVNIAGQTLWIFLKPLIGGAGVGIIIGFAGRWLLTVISKAGKPDSQLLNLFAVGVCMISVGVGEAVTPEAGLAAVTISGVIMAQASVLGGTVLREFKELLAIILVGTLFVMLASRFDVAQLHTFDWREAVYVLILVFAIRPLGVLLSTWGSRLSRRERLFAATFAPRGIVALSVAAVASAELHETASGEGLDAVALNATSWVADIDRLDRIVFIVIVGTVLLASTISPLIAWLFNVHAGRGNAVLLLGAHPLSVAFARALGAVGIDVRLVDSNMIRVAEANDQKLS
ncbi:MAG TPA: cation:proton antiporter, partial [Phycisphaerales bacterium]|nr:cation:proton antiporter [Phycisphaerales bacterium]